MVTSNANLWAAPGSSASTEDARVDVDPETSLDQPVARAELTARWSAPFRTGLIPLRPLTFGQMLAIPFQILRHNPKPVVGGGLAITLVALALSTVTVYFMVTTVMEPYFRDPMRVTEFIGSIVFSGIVTAVVPIILLIAGAVTLQAIVTIDVAHGAINRKADFMTFVRILRPRALKLILQVVLTIVIATVAAAVLIGLGAYSIYLVIDLSFSVGGLALFLVPLIALALALFMGVVASTIIASPSVVVIEGAGPIRALGRTWQLQRGKRVRTFILLGFVNMGVGLASGGIQFVVFIVSLIFGSASLPGQGDTLLTLSGGVAEFAGPIAGAILMVGFSTIVYSALGAVIYLDGRFRNEGLDVELLGYIEATAEGKDAPNPFDQPTAERLAWVQNALRQQSMFAPVDPLRSKKLRQSYGAPSQMYVPGAAR